MRRAVATERRPVQSDAFEQFDREQRLIRRLGQLGSQVNEGVTDKATRAERVRQAILTGRLEECICGRDLERKALTFREVFERVFGEPLITPTMKAAADRLRHRRPEGS